MFRQNILIAVAATALLAGCGDDPAAEKQTRLQDALSRARTLVALQDYTAAVTVLEPLAENHPTHPEVRLLLARCYARTRRSQGHHQPDDRVTAQLIVLTNLGPAGRAAILEALSDGGPVLVANAMRVAAGKGLSESIAPIVAATQADPSLIDVAADALAEIGGLEAAQGILTLQQIPPSHGARRRPPSLRSEYRRALHKVDAPAVRSCRDPELLTDVALNARRDLRVYQALLDRDDLKPSVRIRTVKCIRTAPDFNPERHLALLEALVAPDRPVDEVGWAALEEIIAVSPEAAVDPLLKYLKDPTWAAKALSRLSSLRTPRRTPVMLQLLADKSDPEKFRQWPVKRDKVRWHLLASGADIQTKLQITRLTAHPNPDPERPKGPLPDRMPTTDDPKEHWWLIEQVLADADPAVRRMGAEALSREGDRGDGSKAVARAIPLLEDENPDIQGYAAETLRKFADKGEVSAEVLATFATSNRRPFVDIAVDKALYGPRAKPDVYLALLANGLLTEKELIKTVRIVRELRDPRAVDLLVGRILSFNKRTGACGEIAMAINTCSRNVRGVARKLASALQGASDPVKHNISRALTTLGDPSVVPAIQEAMKTVQDPKCLATMQHTVRELRKFSTPLPAPQGRQ